MIAAGYRAERERADQDRADQADRVGFENVRRHAGAIADVIAHVIRDRRRIARIVFFEIALDFADQIGADVRGLGVNAAAKPREHADQTRPERQTDQALHRHVVADPYCSRACRKFRPTGARGRRRASPVTAPPLNATRIAAVRDWLAACVVRVFASTAMRMPM